jgi:hypothetical protein
LDCRHNEFPAAIYDLAGGTVRLTEPRIAPHDRRPMGFDKLAQSRTPGKGKSLLDAAPQFVLPFGCDKNVFICHLKRVVTCYPGRFDGSASRQAETHKVAGTLAPQPLEPRTRVLRLRLFLSLGWTRDICFRPPQMGGEPFCCTCLAQSEPPQARLHFAQRAVRRTNFRTRPQHRNRPGTDNAW